MQFPNLCTPALVYLVLALIGILGQISQRPAKLNGPSVVSFIAKLIVVGLITYGLDYVCKKYSARYSWYILAFIFLPLILLVTFTLLFLISMLFVR